MIKEKVPKGKKKEKQLLTTENKFQTANGKIPQDLVSSKSKIKKQKRKLYNNLQGNLVASNLDLTNRAQTLVHL